MSPGTRAMTYILESEATLPAIQAKHQVGFQCHTESNQRVDSEPPRRRNVPVHIDSTAAGRGSDRHGQHSLPYNSSSNSYCSTRADERRGSWELRPRLHHDCVTAPGPARLGRDSLERTFALNVLQFTPCDVYIWLESSHLSSHTRCKLLRLHWKGLICCS